MENRAAPAGFKDQELIPELIIETKVHSCCVN